MSDSRKEADKICKYFYVDLYFHPVCGAPEDFRNKCGMLSTEEGMAGFGPDLDVTEMQKFVLYRCDKLKHLCDRTGHLPSKIAFKYRRQIDNENLAAVTYNFIEDEMRVHAKIGRNDPCPCGSGKKYKNCCGR
ncbi:hypothetical protein AUJ66_04720 [Candidatus Desantisbacteria bacterium CG1_02_38_46]|uniref:Zinc chelation protein SecC n=1 Tax=Candidatus Desantisbacteria bacterium CG1_02_38_46 TaxID=1817893 RepID=A0A1J4SE36_9BACT|nr:MAG: hypothetical protein AUJ66_04720 [Candidatus Desantisbacteria bacterium CG1_02_38_46]